MPLLKFGKNKGEADELDVADDMLEDDEEDGSMFMASGGEPAAAAGEGGTPGAELAPTDAPEAEDPSEGDDEEGGEAPDSPDDSVGPVDEGAGDQPADEDGSGEASSEEGEQQDYQVQTVDGGGSDDALALFEDVTGQSGLDHLTSDLEDAPIQELLSELREVRGMLPAVSIDADDPTEE